MIKIDLEEMLKLPERDRNKFFIDECRRDKEQLVEISYSEIITAIMITADITMVLDNSSIDLLISDDEVAILVQNGKIYAVDSIVEGCQFINFDSLRKLVKEKVYNVIDKNKPIYMHDIMDRK